MIARAVLLVLLLAGCAPHKLTEAQIAAETKACADKNRGANAFEADKDGNITKIVCERLPGDW